MGRSTLLARRTKDGGYSDKFNASHRINRVIVFDPGSISNSDAIL